MHPRSSRLGTLVAVLITASAFLTQASAAPPTATYRVHLPAVQNNVAVPLTSDQLIDAALARGEINEETALVYKVFAVFGDFQLPARYNGDDRSVVDGDSVKVAMERFSTLSPWAQAIVVPYFIPPIYQGSWEDPVPATGASAAASLSCTDLTPDKWQYVDGVHVRVWWKKSRPGDQATAVAYKNAMETTIWPRLTQLMGREPLSDLPVSCNGGKGTLDIYLDDLVGRSFEQSHTPGCKQTSGYIVLGTDASDRTLAHEFMHAIQDAYNVSVGCVYGTEYAWLCEATATWAMLWLYPDLALETQYAGWFFQPSDNAPSLELKNNSHEYGAFLFFYFLTHHFGNDGLIRTVWENTESNSGLEAVNKVIPGGLAAVWDTFAVYNWDRPPYNDYQKWDGLALTPATYRGRNPVITGVYDDTTFVRNLSHLALGYHHYTFSGEAPRLVTFFNGFLYKITQQPLELPISPGLRVLDDGSRQLEFERAPDSEIKGATVQVLFKIEGDSKWTLKDMTDIPYLSWCRDAKDERLEELLIIYTNSEHSPNTYKAGASGGRSAELLVSNVGCYRYSGSASALYAGATEGQSSEDLQEVSNVVWERTAAYPDIPYPYITFRTMSGNWNRAYSLTGYCTGQATDSAALTEEDQNYLYQFYGLEGGTNRAYTGEANLARLLTFTATCPDGPEPFYAPSNWWFAVDYLTLLNEHPYLADTAGVLEGSGDFIPGDPSIHFTWHFEPQRQD